MVRKMSLDLRTGRLVWLWLWHVRKREPMLRL